ncbi:hypothetical protein [Neobacillus drentensis]|uniref:hypothetical protein n=1 Tax=Neobacillus drentensis TaxID=220684 RepID=UPI0030013A56
MENGRMKVLAEMKTMMIDVFASMETKKQNIDAMDGIQFDHYLKELYLSMASSAPLIKMGF